MAHKPLVNPVVLDPDKPVFPSVSRALTDPDGLLAVGGNLAPKTLLNAYRHGIFPWYNEDQPICWWSPSERALLYPSDFALSKSLKKQLKTIDAISIDKDFASVIQHCQQLRADEGTWITDEMLAAYLNLHQQGYAHSVEVWQKEKLVGGLYGLSLGGAFFGESMFHLTRDASKVALYALCQHCLALDFDFIDCQLVSAHLSSLGATTVARDSFIQQLKATLTKPTQQGSWQK